MAHTTFTGVPASPGRAVGPIVHMPPPIGEPTTRRISEESCDTAIAAIEKASTDVEQDLTQRAKEAQGTAGDILSVTAAMAADPMLAADAIQRVRDDHVTAERAVWDAAGAVAVQFELLGPPMAERAQDVRDVRDRIVAALTHKEPPGVPNPGHPFILVAPDLVPAHTATLDPQKVLAIVTAGGGPTSHTAIIARTLGIPAIVAAPDAVKLSAQDTVLVNADSGEVVVNPASVDVQSAGFHNDGGGKIHARSILSTPPFHSDVVTQDGAPIELLANVADVGEAIQAAAAGARGVGLFRTEFCFLGRGEEPTVSEQVSAYHQVFEHFQGRRVVVRTLDAGADKPLRFLAPTQEDNPALGVRGIRTAVLHPDVLQRQLEAIAIAAHTASTKVWVMAPMIATVEETRDFVAACADHGLKMAGIMIETPAAALQARWLLREAAFASVGTNDLTQYTMAADRDQAEVAAWSTPWQPAMLRLVQMACEGSRESDRPVGVCGEAAADPLLAPVLVGLGVASLSMTHRALASVGAALSALKYSECEDLARIALNQPSALSAREAVSKAVGTNSSCTL